MPFWMHFKSVAFHGDPITVSIQINNLPKIEENYSNQSRQSEYGGQQNANIVKEIRTAYAAVGCATG